MHKELMAQRVIHLTLMSEHISNSTKQRILRANKIVAYLKRTYPKPKSELNHKTNFQFVVAVILSAQCTDKKVNALTETLFKKYKSVNNFACTDWVTFAEEISSITFFRAKAKHIIASAKMVLDVCGGIVPDTQDELIKLPGVGYKTAHVVLGELFDKWDGIATDTHVRRFALRFNLTDHTDPTRISKDLEILIPKRDWKYINNGLVLYGRYVCPARAHDCEQHPLTKLYPNAAAIWPKAK